MKLPFFIVAVLLIVPLPGSRPGYGKGRDYSVQVTWDKTRPALGPNRLQIVVTDEASRPVAGAEVKIVLPHAVPAGKTADDGVFHDGVARRQQVRGDDRSDHEGRLEDGRFGHGRATRREGDLHLRGQMINGMKQSRITAESIAASRRP